MAAQADPHSTTSSPSGTSRPAVIMTSAGPVGRAIAADRDRVSDDPAAIGSLLNPAS